MVDETKEKIKNSIKETDTQENLFPNLSRKEIEEAFENEYPKVVRSIIENTIEIPRITVKLKDKTNCGFKDFDLNTKNMVQFPPVEQEIFVRYLQEQKKTQTYSVINQGSSGTESWLNAIVNELLNFDEIDYEDHADLLYKLSNQAIEYLKTYLSSDSDIDNVIQYYKSEISNYIHNQMKENFYCETDGFEDLDIQEFTRIEPHNYRKVKQEEVCRSRDHVESKAELVKNIYNYYKKAGHVYYKYDSIPEKEFASPCG